MRMMRRAGLLKRKIRVTQDFLLSSVDTANSTYTEVSGSSATNACNTYPESGSASTYSGFNLSRSGANIYYNFDLSSIPQNFKIINISCNIASGIYYYFTSPSQSYVEICNGTSSITTNRGSIPSYTSATYGIVTISDSDLNITNFNRNNTKLHIYISGATNSSYYLMGAKLTITYEY